MHVSPLLISLPNGLPIGGVSTFAVRLANGLAAAGRHVTLLIHPEPAGVAPLDAELHPAVEVLRPPIPHIADSPGDLAPFIPHYLGVVRRLAAQSGAPAAFAPQAHGDAFGIGAAICLTEPASVRVLGWQHSDNEYDTRVLTRYEPAISRFIAVSDKLEATLRQRIPGRAGDILNIPCGVEVVEGPGGTGPRFVRAPVPGANEPFRLIYTGRIEHQPKRILALIYLSDELTRRGIPHRITAVGDGPAGPEFDGAITGRPCVRRLPPRPLCDIAPLLAEHDVFILPSRFEGLSVSMLEAMAAGCVPILARTDSGARQVIEPGYNGQIADVSPDAAEPEVAAALADTIARFLSRSPEARAAMSVAAQDTVRERFSIQRHIAAVSALLDELPDTQPRPWRADRPCAFTTQESGIRAQESGSVPADGPGRLRTLLQSLAGRAVVIHGTGQHTLQLGAILAASPARILAFTDDDRQRRGQTLWNWPIIAPEDAAKAGATDVVISSWMHQAAIWARRSVYESRGLRVHRVYQP